MRASTIAAFTVLLGRFLIQASTAAQIPVCPAFNNSICIFAKPGHPQCHNDSQCPQPRKCCCSGNCGWACLDPEYVKPGRCPDIKAKCKKLSYKCSNDGDCLGRAKCCNICGGTCQEPNPEPVGICPKSDGTNSGDLSCGSVYCSRDSDCKMDEKCSISGGQQVCVKTIPDRTSQCPNIICKRYTYTCNTDKDCKDNKKCCEVCGRNCY